MRLVFIHAHARIFHVTTMCRVLEVSKAGYYAWRTRPLCERVREDRVLSERIRQIHDTVKGRYGSPRMHQELRALGIRCGKKRVARLMKTEGLRSKSARRFRVTTRSDHPQPVAPNLLDRQLSLATHAALTNQHRRCWLRQRRGTRVGQPGLSQQAIEGNSHRSNYRKYSLSPVVAAM